MDYEKKYKEALEVIKDNLDALNEITETGANVVNIQSIKNCFYRAFPEIKEPEDDGIRKSLIKILNEIVINTNYKELGIDYGIKDIIAWLKKQGGQKIDIPKWKYKKDNTPLLRDSIILNKYGCVAKSPSCAIISDAWVLDYDELAKLPKEEVEKQEEKPQVEAKDYSSIDPLFFKTTDVEKETDFKLELDFDFSVGQWIVACGKKVFRITKIDGFNVTLVDTNGDEYVFDVSSLKDARLWTIEDAEDGDVLSNGKMIVIFKHFEEPSYKHIVAYIGLDEIGAIQVTDDTWNFGNYKTTPATKEQRDLLFQKMKDAGYEFNFEKKELKEIEDESEDCKQQIMSEIADLAIDYIKQKQAIDDLDSLPKDNWELVHEFVEKFGRIPEDEDELNVLVEYVLKRQKPTEWSYEDEANLNNIIWLCNNCIKGSETTWIPSQAAKIKRLIETIKEKGLAQQNFAWSGEDDYNLQCMIAKVTSDIQNGNIGRNNELMDWLKSLKQRIGG